MAFDSNHMLELAHLKADRYHRAGGGGAFKVYNSSKAYDEAKGYKEMSRGKRAAYEAIRLWRLAASQARSDFKWDCHVLTLDTVNGEIPF